MQPKEIANFFYEMGQLSRVKREGWRLLGIESPESIAEHSLRAAQIGWVLAKLENHPSPNEVATMLIFHDIGECRIGDLHKLASRYGTLDEKRAVEEQISRLGAAGEEILSLWNQIEERSTPAGVIAKDADLLELAVRAREYIERGYVDAKEWFDTAASLVKTESARTLIRELPSVSSTEWWHGLKSRQ
jgi:putative hydrolase of HD superfamily